MLNVEYMIIRDGVARTELGTFQPGDIAKKTMEAQRGARYAIVRVNRLIDA